MRTRTRTRTRTTRTTTRMTTRPTTRRTTRTMTRMTTRTGRGNCVEVQMFGDSSCAPASGNLWQTFDSDEMTMTTTMTMTMTTTTRSTGSTVAHFVRYFSLLCIDGASGGGPLLHRCLIDLLLPLPPDGGCCLHSGAGCGCVGCGCTFSQCQSWGCWCGCVFHHLFIRGRWVHTLLVID